ncbi:MAG: mannose-1-phosphate guanylyltransferase, partial [Parcubacteria group bacterium QH_9_35_7]
MKILIFAVGTGRRLWPLSRKESPKQFQIFKEGKSTLQRAVDRVREFGLEHVYIATNKKYKQEVQDQIPSIEA